MKSLLPPPVAIGPVRTDWRFVPSASLGGDSFGYHWLDEDTFAIYLVDVSGHGVASSLLSVAIGRTLTSHASASSLLVKEVDGQLVITPPSEVANELNQRFPMEEQNGLYFTMAYGVLDLQSLEFCFASAGHVPIVHIPKGGQPEVFKVPSMGIGWFDDIEYSDHTVKLQPGDRMYLYSDGVPEAMNADSDQFETRQMLEVLELGKSQSLDDSVSLLLRSVERWCAKHGPKDDVSILGFEISDDIPKLD